MDAFQRILWKEFRAQLHVWVALTIGILLIQSLVTGVTLLTEEWLGAGWLEGMFAVAIVIGVCYSAASGAILFAGEREDETAFLLRVFPVRPRDLIGGKLTFTILSLGVLLLVGFLSALALGAAFSQAPLQLSVHTGIVARSLIGGLVWGILFSLLLDRVMNALGAAILAEFTLCAVTGNLFTDPWIDRTYWTAILAVAGIDLWLARRWAAGWNFSLDAAIPARSRQEARHVTRWKRLLQSFATSGSPGLRGTGVLFWRELRGAIPFLGWWTIVGVLLVDLGMRWEPRIPFNVLFFFLTPIICGLMTCLGDQRRQVFRFLTDRGVPPLRIWSIKILTWLTVGLLLTLVFGLWDVANLAQSHLYPWRHETFSAVDAIREVVRVPGDSETAPASRHLQRAFSVSLWLMLFVAAQWSAFLHRRPIVGAVAGIGLGFAVVAWHFLMIGGDIPLGLSTWPVILAGLAATAGMSSHWLLEDRSWRARFQRTAWIGLPLLFVLVAARSHRIHSVPVVGNLNPRLADAHEGRVLPAGGMISLETPALRRLRNVGLPEGVPEAAGHMNPSSALLLMQTAGRELRSQGKLAEEWAALRDLLIELRKHAGLLDEPRNWEATIEQSERVLAQMREWMAAPGQTPELLDQAIADLQQQDVRFDPGPMLENRFHRWRSFLNGEDVGASDLVPFKMTPTLTILGWLTGETERARRLLTLVTHSQLLSWLEIRSAENDSERAAEQSRVAQQERYRMRAVLGEFDLQRLVHSTAFLPPPMRWGLQDEHFSSSGIPHHVAAVRGTLICLALHRYRLEHQKFPESLSDLEPGILKELPLDPYSGVDFLYEAAGYPLTLVIRSPNHSYRPAENDLAVPAGQPLLLTVGPHGHRIGRVRKPQEHLEATSRYSSTAEKLPLPTPLSPPDPGRIQFIIPD